MSMLPNHPIPTEHIGIGRAYSNMALVKYWGKRQVTLNLPTTSSLSLPLNSFLTVTEIAPAHEHDRLVIDGIESTPLQLARAQRVLEVFRNLTGDRTPVGIQSTNGFPMAQGLASSASGMAALTRAANGYYRCGLSEPELSVVARLGSGSAARSIPYGLVHWHKGRHLDGRDSFAEALSNGRDAMQKMRLAWVTILGEICPKQVSSTNGMSLKRYPQLAYAHWSDQNESCLSKILLAFQKLDLEQIGALTESNAISLHTLISQAKPKLKYWNCETTLLFQQVRSLRDSGLPVWGTLDAGHTVTLLTTIDTVPILKRLLSDPYRLIVHDLSSGVPPLDRPQRSLHLKSF